MPNTFRSNILGGRGPTVQVIGNPYVTASQPASQLNASELANIVFGLPLPEEAMPASEARQRVMGWGVEELPNGELALARVPWSRISSRQTAIEADKKHRLAQRHNTLTQINRFLKAVEYDNNYLAKLAKLAASNKEQEGASG
jgi:hypothetical protein